MTEKKVTPFHEMELDDRLLKSIAQMGWKMPTLIQEAAIPLLLEGKDVVVRARTGSGKTAAFALPLIQKILHSKLNAAEQCTSALILSPGNELCQQTKSTMSQMTSTCGKIIKIVDLSTSDTIAQKYILSERPDVIIGTPSKVLLHLQSGALDLRHLETLVVDEADLIFSFGFENDFMKILKFLPAIFQSVLVSATITEEVIQLKKNMLHNPVTLKLEEPEIVPESQLSHQRVLAEENDKAAILYALLKLHLIRGKTIIFVNTVDRCYKLKLFLEQFGIKTCAFNNELPTKIRIHTIHQFNQGLYDFIIASDERMLENPGRIKGDKESGASRGIDFHCVSNVINFDFPFDIDSYIHRAGRTARGINKGNVLSFVNTKEMEINNKVEEFLKSGFSTNEQVIKNYQFKLEEIASFRYRAQDAWRAVTRIAVHDARLREIKAEMMNNEKLKLYFTEHPDELNAFRHDKRLKTIKIQPHLSHIPDYMVPKALKRLTITTNSTKNRREYRSKAQAIYESRQKNPLLCADIDYAKKHIRSRKRN